MTQTQDTRWANSYRKKRLHQHGMFGLPEGFTCCNLFCSFVGVQIRVIENWHHKEVGLWGTTLDNLRQVIEHAVAKCRVISPISCNIIKCYYIHPPPSLTWQRCCHIVCLFLTWWLVHESWGQILFFALPQASMARRGHHKMCHAS